MQDDPEAANLHSILLQRWALLSIVASATERSRYRRATPAAKAGVDV
jgi:hypothetical protein